MSISTVSYILLGVGIVATVLLSLQKPRGGTIDNAGLIVLLRKGKK